MCRGTSAFHCRLCDYSFSLLCEPPRSLLSWLKGHALLVSSIPLSFTIPLPPSSLGFPEIWEVCNLGSLFTWLNLFYMHKTTKSQSPVWDSALYRGWENRRKIANVKKPQLGSHTLPLTGVWTDNTIQIISLVSIGQFKCHLLIILDIYLMGIFTCPKLMTSGLYEDARSWRLFGCPLWG